MATVNYLLAAALTSITFTASGCDESEDGTATIGPRGGTVTSPDGRVTLEIPQGALDHETVITIGEVDHGPNGTLGFAYEIEPRLTTLHAPATLTFSLEAGDEKADGDRAFNLADADMTVEDVLLVAEKADGWDALADRDANEDALTISGSVLFLSTYAVVPRD